MIKDEVREALLYAVLQGGTVSHRDMRDRFGNDFFYRTLVKDGYVKHVRAPNSQDLQIVSVDGGRGVAYRITAKGLETLK